jgi:hypothetical protein
MSGTRIQKKVEICATNLANKTKCTSTNAKKWGLLYSTDGVFCILSYLDPPPPPPSIPLISIEVSNSQRSERRDRFFTVFQKVSISSAQVLLRRWHMR